MKKTASPINNNHGALTVDFIFAFTLIMGLSAILLALSLTMTVASITQYATFASARALFVAHHTTRDQIANAKVQYDRVTKNGVFGPLYAGGWFALGEAGYYVDPGDINKYSAGFPEVTIPPNQPDLFIGISVKFFAKMLALEIPFFGSTAGDGGDGSGFSTTIASFLSKEPSEQVCKDFASDRWKAIRKLNVPGGYADYSTNTNDGGAIYWINDNGC